MGKQSRSHYGFGQRAATAVFEKEQAPGALNAGDPVVKAACERKAPTDAGDVIFSSSQACWDKSCYMQMERAIGHDTLPALASAQLATQAASQRSTQAAAQRSAQPAAESVSQTASQRSAQLASQSAQAAAQAEAQLAQAASQSAQAAAQPAAQSATQRPAPQPAAQSAKVLEQFVPVSASEEKPAPPSWGEAAPSDKTLAPLISVVSASGGAGKSTIALLAAMLAAKGKIQTALIEADLQFGDMGFWLGLDDELPTLALGAQCEPLHIAERLELYKAPCFPEAAEEVSDAVADFVPQIRGRAGLVIADTGSFWSGLTADLIVASDLILLVMDQRPASIAGAVRASELISRLGVPGVRRVCVYNRWTSRARITAQEARHVLEVNEIHCIAEGKAIVDELMCTGNAEELIEQDGGCVASVRELLADVLPRVGLMYSDTAVKRSVGLFR